jgi:hypothetical protein
MLQGFIDDSGWDGQSPVFVLADYIAKTEQWEAFSDEWQKASDHPEPAPIQILKTNQIRPYLGGGYSPMLNGPTPTSEAALPDL